MPTTNTPTEEPCTVCETPVTIKIQPGSGLADVDAHGYDGLTDSGEPVCRDHFCTVCGEHHADADAFDACAFHGPPLWVDRTPPCSADARAHG